MKRIFAVFILALLFSSCAHVENTWHNVTGLFGKNKDEEEAERLFAAITPEQEYVIGRAVAANILSAYRLQTNRPGLTAYVNQVCYALVLNSPRPDIYNGYHVAILDSDEINAFATPGGHIFLTRGLIDCATSEDTLAAVIAHEIAHIQLGHGLRAIRNDRFTQVILGGVNSLVSGVAGAFNNAELATTLNESVNDIIGTMVTNGYSQTQEFAADSKAMSLLAWAGYSPSSVIEILRMLEQTQPGKPGGFNSTHPTPRQRISNIQRHAASFRVSDTRSYREDRFASITVR